MAGSAHEQAKAELGRVLIDQVAVPFGPPTTREVITEAAHRPDRPTSWLFSASSGGILAVSLPTSFALKAAGVCYSAPAGTLLAGALMVVGGLSLMRYLRRHLLDNRVPRSTNMSSRCRRSCRGPAPPSCRVSPQ